MIKIYHTILQTSISDIHFDSLVQVLPEQQKEKVFGFRRRPDAFAFLLGRFLLLYGLKDLGYSRIKLDDLKYSTYGRPYFDEPIDFNISHSAECIVCVLSTQGKVGIDVEKIGNIALDPFLNIFNSIEKNSIAEAGDKNEMFYNLWTRKEAAVKLLGFGLSLELNEISILSDSNSFGETTYHLKRIDIQNNYACHIAADQRIDLDNLTIERDVNPLDHIMLFPKPLGRDISLTRI